jgi:hypothetical protein
MQPDSAVTQREHAAVQRNQSASPNAVSNQSGTKSELEQLPPRHHPMLTFRQRSDKRSGSLAGQRIAFGRKYVPNAMRCGVERHLASIADLGPRVVRAGSQL